MVMGDNGINGDKKCRQIDNNFDPHAAGEIQRNAHCPMEHIRGFMQATRCRHWASVRAVLPRRLPWLTILKETQKH
jgi:hypothetical protein